MTKSQTRNDSFVKIWIWGFGFGVSPLKPPQFLCSTNHLTLVIISPLAGWGSQEIPTGS